MGTDDDRQRNAATYNDARTAIARAGDTLYELLAEDCRRSEFDIDILEEIDARQGSWMATSKAERA